MRKYERTHPWLTFNLNLDTLRPEVWMMLGEVRSKCEHLANVPLRPEVARHFYQVTLARGVHATTAIEGNTLSADEVQRQLEGKLELPESKAYLAQEVDNVFAALNGIVGRELSAGHLAPLTPDRIQEFNALILKGLALGDGVVPGALREHGVTVARYAGAPPEDCDHLLQRLCSWLAGPSFDSSSNPPGFEVPVAVIQAIVAHLYLAWIHPFGDGNGRTARLVELQLLATAGIPDVACQLLSNHYNQTRAVYYRQLDRASRSGGDVLPFLEYAIRGLVDGLTEQVDQVRSLQWDVSWVNHVHESFKRNTRSAKRMKDLVLTLSRATVPVARRDIARLSADTALAYRETTEKTLSRDLNTLEEMGLLVKEQAGYRAKKETILAFLPRRNRKTPRATPTEA